VIIYIFLDMVESQLHESFTKLDLNAEFWDGRLLMLNQMCYIITDRSPVHIQTTANQSGNILIYKYLVSGSIHDTLLGIWVFDMKKINNTPSIIAIEGKFYNKTVTARGNKSILQRKVVHIIPGPTFKTNITGISTDLIPGIIGPMIADGNIKLEKRYDWNDKLNSSVVKRKFIGSDDYDDVNTINHGDCFYVFGNTILKVAHMPAVLVSSEILNRFQRITYDVHKKVDIPELLQLDYINKLMPMTPFRLKLGLTTQIKINSGDQKDE